MTTDSRLKDLPLVQLLGERWERWRDGYEWGRDLDSRFPRNEAGDFTSAITYNHHPFGAEFPVIKNLVCTKVGENDGGDWNWLVWVYDEVWLATGGCDYTGWDCQSDLDWQRVELPVPWPSNRWDRNPYSNPERVGLEQIASHDAAGVAWEFDMVIVWRDIATGKFYWDSDIGCSCPMPFEGISSLDDLRGLPETLPELRAVIDGWCANMSRWRNGMSIEEANAFWRKLHEAGCEI